VEGRTAVGGAGGAWAAGGGCGLGSGARGVLHLVFGST